MRYDGRHDGTGHAGHPGRYDDRYHGKPGYHRYDGYRYRTRVYRYYEYAPYYAPVAVAYPYYCDICHSGFYSEYLFYNHLCFVHHLSQALIPGLLYWYGGTFFFGGW